MIFRQLFDANTSTYTYLVADEGSRQAALIDPVREQIERVYPGHDYHGHAQSSIAEEKLHNPRLAGKSRGDFVTLMSELHLPRPAHMDEGVPANRACGNAQSLVASAWHAAREAGGYRDIPARAARALLGQVRFVDVREPQEYRSAHVAGAELVPEKSLRESASAWSRELPLLLVCRSGRRSASAAEALTRLGFQRVFNLDGGMQAWEAQGLDVVRSQPERA